MRAALPILIVLVGCSTATTAKVYTREEFKREFLGATLDELRAKLGSPDETNIPEATWTYRNRTKSGKTGKVDAVVRIAHANNRVEWIGLKDD